MNKFEKANPTYMKEIKDYAKQIIDEKQYGSLEYILMQYDRFSKMKQLLPAFTYSDDEHTYWDMCECCGE